MKRIVTGLAALFLTLGAFAQGGIPILDRVPGHRVLFHYTYSLSQGGRPMTQVTDGDVVVEDNAYLLSGLGLEVRSDGTTRWSMDRAAEEVLIETVEKEDLFTNPALFINSYKGYMDKIRVNGSSSNSLDVTLVLDEDTSARFVLKNIVFEDKQGKSDFTLNVKSLPDSYVASPFLRMWCAPRSLSRECSGRRPCRGHPRRRWRSRRRRSRRAACSGAS